MFSNSNTHQAVLFKVIYYFITVALLLIVFPTSSVLASSFLDGTYNGRAYKVYIPDSYTGDVAVPLMVMLHGCAQNPVDFATGTEMNSYADAQNFIVLYPEQPDSANPYRCWNWFDPIHQARNSGEPALIAGMTSQIKNQYNIDSKRVYVAGLSAGAGMSVIMGVTYPDVYTAIAVNAGLEYKVATDSISAWSVMVTGGPNPYLQGNIAYSVMGNYARVVPTIVFHGTSDSTVYPINGHQVLSQWAQTNDWASDGVNNNNSDDIHDSTTYSSVPGGRSYTHYEYEDENSTVILEKYFIDGMEHAWSGGNSSGSFTDPQGPKASEIILDFFSNYLMPEPDPTLTLTSMAAQDGYAGMFLIDGYSVNTHKLGDKGMFNIDTYRTILSFDSSVIPAGATIKGVTLRFYRQSLSGSISSINVDIKSGYFYNSSALELSDYNALPSAYSVATTTAPTANNQAADVDIPSSAWQYLNLNGLTQFRLKTITLADYTSDILTIYGGEDSTYAPVLIITYSE